MMINVNVLVKAATSPTAREIGKKAAGYAVGMVMGNALCAIIFNDSKPAPIPTKTKTMYASQRAKGEFNNKVNPEGKKIGYI